MVRPRLQKGTDHARGRGNVNRDFFPKLITSLNLFGNGVEVGVWRGVHALMLLQNWEKGVLFCVDPWKTGAEFNENGECIDASGFTPQSGRRMEGCYKSALKALDKFISSGRCVVMRKTSEEASANFKDASLDWVYLDAQHHGKGSRQDIEMWIPKVRSGGVIGGHDYFYEPPKFEVKSAVDGYFGDYAVSVSTSPVASWYVLIP